MITFEYTCRIDMRRRIQVSLEDPTHGQFLIEQLVRPNWESKYDSDPTVLWFVSVQVTAKHPQFSAKVANKPPMHILRDVVEFVGTLKPRLEDIKGGIDAGEPRMVVMHSDDYMGTVRMFALRTSVGKRMADYAEEALKQWYALLHNLLTDHFTK